MGPTKPPTAAERRYMNKIVELGCAVCRKHYGIYTPAGIHHIVEGGKRLGHFYSIPLCPRHHNVPGPGYETRHPNKARFEAAYGTEYELLEYVGKLLERDEDAA